MSNLYLCLNSMKIDVCEYKEIIGRLHLLPFFINLIVTRGCTVRTRLVGP